SATAPPAVGPDVTEHPTAPTANPANLCGHSTSGGSNGRLALVLSTVEQLAGKLDLNTEGSQ
ncbi:hypothetical protein, partial [Streptomyces sp. NPDC088733]|uniref:hypothetical protein n=1 Tax=Streptomyces sp. NPDC088733 TaxID=3365880 RepID=UPI0038179CE7